jgi:sigma-B regulation protein RsbU (phosphoserine phosphatase)
MPRILVADDQPDILQALRWLLTDAGFDTDLVTSVDAAVDRLGETTFDLVLMDLNYSRDTTSGREGLALLDRVVAVDRMLPVVVMTGWGTIETAVEAMRRGARSYVQKPWDDATLVEVVRREVDAGRAGRRRDATLTREHEEARLIQRALLPSTIPTVPGCDIAARWTSASGLGGDCYDLLRLGDSRLAVSIADVIGKGLPAALLMSNLQAAVRAFATPAASPHEVCANVNRLLCRNVSPGKFVTFCYVVIDLAAGEITYANAGHNPPIVVRRSGEQTRLEPTGLVLGVMPDWTYRAGRMRFAAGDRLVCFTDGLTEARSSDDEEFGEDRLQAALATQPAQSAGDLVASLIESAQAWTGGDLQDDATLIVIDLLDPA